MIGPARRRPAESHRPGRALGRMGSGGLLAVAAGWVGCGPPDAPDLSPPPALDLRLAERPWDLLLTVVEADADGDLGLVGAQTFVSSGRWRLDRDGRHVYAGPRGQVWAAVRAATEPPVLDWSDGPGPAVQVDDLGLEPEPFIATWFPRDDDRYAARVEADYIEWTAPAAAHLPSPAVEARTGRSGDRTVSVRLRYSLQPSRPSACPPPPAASRPDLLTLGDGSQPQRLDLDRVGPVEVAPSVPDVVALAFDAAGARVSRAAGTARLTLQKSPCSVQRMLARAQEDPDWERKLADLWCPERCADQDDPWNVLLQAAASVTVAGLEAACHEAERHSARVDPPHERFEWARPGDVRRSRLQTFPGQGSWLVRSHAATDGQGCGVRLDLHVRPDAVFAWADQVQDLVAHAPGDGDWQAAWTWLERLRTTWLLETGTPGHVARIWNRLIRSGPVVDAVTQQRRQSALQERLAIHAPALAARWFAQAQADRAAWPVRVNARARLMEAGYAGFVADDVAGPLEIARDLQSLPPPRARIETQQGLLEHHALQAVLHAFGVAPNLAGSSQPGEYGPSASATDRLPMVLRSQVVEPGPYDEAVLGHLYAGTTASEPFESCSAAVGLSFGRSGCAAFDQGAQPHEAAAHARHRALVELMRRARTESPATGGEDAWLRLLWIARAAAESLDARAQEDLRNLEGAEAASEMGAVAQAMNAISDLTNRPQPGWWCHREGWGWLPCASPSELQVHFPPGVGVRLADRRAWSAMGPRILARDTSAPGHPTRPFGPLLRGLIAHRGVPEPASVCRDTTGSLSAGRLTPTRLLDARNGAPADRPRNCSAWDPIQDPQLAPDLLPWLEAVALLHPDAEPTLNVRVGGPAADCEVQLEGHRYGASRDPDPWRDAACDLLSWAERNPLKATPNVRLLATTQAP